MIIKYDTYIKENYLVDFYHSKMITNMLKTIVKKYSNSNLKVEEITNYKHNNAQLVKLSIESNSISSFSASNCFSVKVNPRGILNIFERKSTICSYSVLLNSIILKNILNNFKAIMIYLSMIIS